MSIFEDQGYLNPKYDRFNKFTKTALKSFWTPAKYKQKIESKDAFEYRNHLDESLKSLIERCILSVSVVEDKVKLFWGLIPLDYPQTLISDAASMLSMQEVVHRRSYNSLGKAIGVPRDAIERYPILKDRIKYLNKHLEEDVNITGNARKLKKLTLFTGLVEKISLTVSFYILMSPAKRINKLKGISELQATTAVEENFHFDFGLEIINTVKEENPEIWTEYLVQHMNKNFMMAYETELKMIDWFFEKGVPDFITKEEVINVLNYNFNFVSNKLGLGLDFEYDEELYREKNEWFFVMTKSPLAIDFFDGTAGGYSGEKEVDSIDIDAFEL